MTRRSRVLGLLLAGLVLAGGVGLLAQRPALERLWVEYRAPAIRARARAILTAGLEHEDKFVRIECAGFLARMGEPQSFAVLARAARDVNPVARQAAALRLPAAELRGVPVLKSLLSDERVYVRERTVRALGHMKNDSAREVLRAEWARPEHVKPAVVLAALLEASPREATDIVAAELEEPQRFTRAAVMQTWMTNRGYFVRSTSRAAANQFEDRMADILRRLEDVGGPTGQEAAVLGAHLAFVRRIRAETGGRITRATRRALPQVPAAAETAATEPGIIQRLHDRDVATRLEAARQLTSLWTASAHAAAATRLQTEESVRVRRALLGMLIAQAPELAVPHVIHDIRSRRTYLRSGVAHMLGDGPDPALIPAYAVAVRSPHTGLRLAAVTALQHVPHPDRQRLLTPLLDDTDAFIQARAAGALLMPW